MGCSRATGEIKCTEQEMHWKEPKAHGRAIGMSPWEASQAMQQAERHQEREGPEGCQCLQYL